jgi:DNA recombination protein RmuC
MEYVLGFLIGIICGGLIISVLSKKKISSLEKESISSKVELVETRAKLDEQQKSMQEKSTLFEEAKNAFKALSADALKDNNSQFLDLAKTKLETFQEGAKSDLEKRQTAIDTLVKPLGESLKKVEAQLKEVEDKRISAYSGLTEQVKSIIVTEEKLRGETSKLVNALRSSPVTRGRWGEIQLHRVVELAGMQQYCDFEEQISTNLETGRIRPDMIIRLPNRKNIVVDSKVVLAAYYEAIETEDEKIKLEKLKEHARQIRIQIKNLSSKSYWDQFQFTPEFVVLFLPEPFFIAALQQDPTLIEFGTQEKVILATTTTLISLLRVIASGWRQEQIAENAQKISNLGKEFYDRASNLACHFNNIQKGLKSTIDAYNNAVGSFESRVLVTARKFRELGAASGNEIPSIPSIDTNTRMLNIEINDNVHDKK